MLIAKTLTTDEKVNLESKFWVLIRNIRKNDKISPSETLRQLSLILNNEYESSPHEEFNQLNNFIKIPKLENENNLDSSLLERKKMIQDLLVKEATSLKMQQAESFRLNRRSASFSSSVISAITRKEVKVYWVYIEFDAIKFINALLENNEKQAHDCIFKQHIPSDAKCYTSCEEASKVMSSTAKYLNGLYLDCLIPLRISFEVSTNYIHAKEANAPTLKHLDTSDITILSCFIGNKNFKEEYCNHANTKDRKILKCSTSFIAEYKRLSASETLYEKNSRIIQTQEKEKCNMC
jgi:hypothetical protein